MLFLIYYYILFCVKKYLVLTEKSLATSNIMQISKKYYLSPIFYFRHFIATLHDDMKYMERKIMVDIGGFNFMYKWHEVILKD